MWYLFLDESYDNHVQLHSIFLSLSLQKKIFKNSTFRHERKIPFLDNARRTSLIGESNIWLWLEYLRYLLKTVQTILRCLKRNQENREPKLCQPIRRPCRLFISIRKVDEIGEGDETKSLWNNEKNYYCDRVVCIMPAMITSVFSSSPILVAHNYKPKSAFTIVSSCKIQPFPVKKKESSHLLLFSLSLSFSLSFSVSLSFVKGKHTTRPTNISYEGCILIKNWCHLRWFGQPGRAFFFFFFLKVNYGEIKFTS